MEEMGLERARTGCRVVDSSPLAAGLWLISGSAAAQDAGVHDANGDGQLDVLVIYDNAGPFSEVGPIFAEMAMNLMGHFEPVAASAIKTSDYSRGDMLLAEVTFYIGATYDNPLPQAFKDDFAVMDRPLIWMGSNLWQIGWEDWNGFLAEFGFQHWYIAGNDGEGQDAEFYRYVQYNGVELAKFAWWNPYDELFVNDPFMSILYAPDPAAFDTVATVVHSGTGDEQPYIIQSSFLTLYADIPLTFVHETDRYLAFADLLHDHLGIDHPVTRQALMRLEDVHPNTSASDLRTVTNVMKEGGVRPWTVALIPEYRDPLGYSLGDGVPVTIPLDSSDARSWRRQLRRATRNGATIVMHGYTHQYGEVLNPFSGVSGDDYEFWDAVADEPVVEDSWEWYSGRLEAGLELIDRYRWMSRATWGFEVPHYRASLQDQLFTNAYFDTIYNRVVYYDFEVEENDEVYTFVDLWNDPDVVDDWSQTVVSPAGTLWGGQFFPYVVEHDVYGQRVVPETLGNIEPAEFALEDWQIRTVPDLLEFAEANLVGRCATASFFFHPYLIQFPELVDAGGADALRTLVQEIEAMGYTFVDASAL